MKSVIQEASTIAKAIEQGWQKADCPEEFTVKIFEIPQKNFLGFSKNNAKVGIFFQGKKLHNKSQTRQKKQTQPQNKQTKQTQTNKPSLSQTVAAQFPTNKNETSQRHIKPKEQHKQPTQQRTVDKQPKQIRKANNLPTEKKESPKAENGWTKEVTESAILWLKGALNALKKEHVFIDYKIENKKLILKLSQKLFNEPNKEAELLKSFEPLIIKAIKTQFKKPFQGLSISISS